MFFPNALTGLHSALLRLLATNYPHLCIVEDWICEEQITGTDALLRRMLLTTIAKNHSPKQLQEGNKCPMQCSFQIVRTQGVLKCVSHSVPLIIILHLCNENVLLQPC